eukprot:gene28360-37292_t
MSGGNTFTGLEMNEERFISLLRQLVGESRELQNSPPQGLIPKEELAANHVLAALRPYTTENGGVLQVQKIDFVQGRSNLIIKYPGTTDEVVSFVGSHLDVVPADPTGWERDPFQLTVEGRTLYGRGTTDCLGHVALLTDLLISLAESRPALRTSVVAVFIANEENSTFVGIGVDQLAKDGYLDQLKGGPLFWIDAADSTAGSTQWQLKVKGKVFHSGLPHKGINSIEMATDAVSYIQKKFFAAFPRHPLEDKYNFYTQSTLKPTQISCAPGALNQLPPECTVQGDIRLAPFYDIAEVQRAVEAFVAEINADPSIIETPDIHGPHSKYQLPDGGVKGSIELKWVVEGENGVACKLDSRGYEALIGATKSVLGDAKPYAIGGSLPLIRSLQEQGFDVQISGYGASAKYHADNESAELDSFQNATKIISKVISILNE